MSKQRGVSGFWLDIKALENHRAHFVGEFGPKEGLLLYGFWIRIFTWQYQSAAPIRDATHAARLTGLNVRTAQRLMRSLAQSLPQSFIQRSGQWYCKRTIQVLNNYNQNQELAGATHDPIKVEDSDSDYEEKNKNPPISPPVKPDHPTPKPKRKPKRAAFRPPDISEVRAYCEERGKGVNAEAWMDHYTSNGWKVGRNSMKDWKAAVRTWERNALRRSNGGNGYPKHANSNADLEALAAKLGIGAKPGETTEAWHMRIRAAATRAH